MKNKKQTLNELDEFLSFLLEHKDDKRILISKKMKYGFRHYYITFTIDEEPKKEGNSSNNNTLNAITSRWRFNDSFEIILDNRNKCIEVIYDGASNIVIEDEKLLDKYSKIIDDLLNVNLEGKLKEIFETTLSSCYNKNLYREYQMRKIFPD